MINPDVQAIRTCRVKQGLSARALAKKARLHGSTIAGIEKTGHPVAPSTAKAISDALGMQFDALFKVDDGR